MEKKMRLRASEREALLRLSVAYDILTNEKETLGARAALVPGGKRDLAMIAARIKTLLAGFCETIPEDQLIIYMRSLQTKHYIIGSKGPATPKSNNHDYGMWLPFDAINEIMKGLHDHCMMCAMDKSERKKCPLKKTLDRIPNDTQDSPDGDCQYYGIL